MSSQAAQRTINLALQGGGAHGAFTWGVLDYLLEDGRFAFEGVSGTSAGAMNAVVLAQGLMSGGEDGARAALADFWGAVANSAAFINSISTDGDESPRLVPGLKLMNLLTKNLFSPSQLNPFDINPLRDILARQIDCERLRDCSPVKLFIATTHANSGKLRLFRSEEISVEAVLASACLPTIHRTVMIDGEPYWDGGYSANPAVFPLFYYCDSPDIMLVLLTPLHYSETPYTARDITLRQQELAFQATFLREMRMFAHMREYVRDEVSPACRFEHRLTQVNFHVLAADELMSGLASESKLIAREQFLLMLRDQGREHAREWLAENADAVGKRATVDLSRLFY
ncbi:patatin-like phospholipase family protein [Rhodocyclus tenuis]|uniref:patatin-like phospholipase family protein n=1 Tax=Rhodocyclus tenuis TaxID=1066 RepID=UPI001902F702|nr:patatin-like phospholipase family protein [Rhodocyclus tenuis]MBK1681697.1 esterase [Rhodocyclus tenuis]